MLGDPSGDALAHPQLEPVEQFVVGVFGGSQDQILPCEDVYKAGITLNHFYCKIQNAIERLMKAVSRGDAADSVVQNIYMRVVNRN